MLEMLMSCCPPCELKRESNQGPVTRCLYLANINLIFRFEFRDTWAFFYIPHSQKYYRGRMCLIGDSAHASTPHLDASGDGF
jgi:hypothetical protein